jgi:hypothetical protein
MVTELVLRGLFRHQFALGGSVLFMQIIQAQLPKEISESNSVN